jgi:hypothetical protein
MDAAVFSERNVDQVHFTTQDYITSHNTLQFRVATDTILYFAISFGITIFTVTRLVARFSST